MKIELISHPLCPFVHRTAIMLREKHVEFSLRYVDLKAKPDWFLALSPRGKVPVLIADGTALFESAVINEFLDETHPPRLLPENPFERALARAWVEIANDLLTAQYRLFVAPTSEALDTARDELGLILDRIARGIANGRIDTTRLGLVEIAMAPALHRFVVLGERLKRSFTANAPRIEAWARAIATRPSVASTVPEDFSDRLLAMLVEHQSELARAA